VCKTWPRVGMDASSLPTPAATLYTPRYALASRSGSSRISPKNVIPHRGGIGRGNIIVDEHRDPAVPDGVDVETDPQRLVVWAEGEEAMHHADGAQWPGREASSITACPDPTRAVPPEGCRARPLARSVARHSAW